MPPLDRALARWPVTISGRKRFQAATRAALEVFEARRRPAAGQPAGALDGAADLRDYMDAHDLPRHPLVPKGYPSIGCAPCTTPVGRARTRGPGAGAAARRSSAASISGRTAASCAWRAEEDAMSVLVTEAGFAPDDWAGREVLPFEVLWSGQDLPEEALAVDFPNDRDPADLGALARPAGADPRRLPGDGRRPRLLDRAPAAGDGLCRAAARRRAADRRPVPRRAPGRLRRGRAARRGGGAPGRGALAAAAAGLVPGAR